MNDRITIEIEPCLQLPEPNTLDNIDLLSQIFSTKKDIPTVSTELAIVKQPESQLESQSEPEQSPETRDPNLENSTQILHHEKIPKHPKTRENITFKRYPSNSKHKLSHTCRTYK
jgi:hypothetical protein